VLKKQVSVYLPRERWEILRKLAALKGIPITQLFLAQCDWRKLARELRELEAANL